MAEQRAFNAEGQGSNPWSPTIEPCRDGRGDHDALVAGAREERLKRGYDVEHSFVLCLWCKEMLALG